MTVTTTAATMGAAMTTEAAATIRQNRRRGSGVERSVSPFLLRRASDENLGGRLAAGEAAAFDELYRRYARRLAAYGANLTGDRSAGDDVAQTGADEGLRRDRRRPRAGSRAAVALPDRTQRRARPDRPPARGADAVGR